MRKDGMNEVLYFFDTYALFEIIRGNENYERYKDVVGITTIFNLAELSYGLKKEVDEKIADEFTDKYNSILVDVGVDDVKEAMSFRKKHKNLSIPDVIGYIVAKRLNAKFLTGDDDFVNFDNVEFVKK